MHTMTLHAQADLWQHGAATFAALFVEGEIRSPDNEVDRTDVLFYAVMNRGLPLARLPAPTARTSPSKPDRIPGPEAELADGPIPIGGTFVRH
jgi:hypothetical protein